MTLSTGDSPFERLKKYLPDNLAGVVSDSMPEKDALSICGHLSSLRDVLSTYLPRYLVEQIGEDPRPDQLRASFKQGSALFADVSGFTAMSEKLSVLGKEGAEEITGIVNDYFETMLDISDRYGGDLLKFGGDALLIFFEGPEGPARAITVATAMQESMSKYSKVMTSQGTFPLRMSIGIGSGQFFLTNLGSIEEMNYAVMGNALSNMAHAEEVATAGEIIVDRTTRDATKDLASFAPKGDNLWQFLSLSSSLVPEWKSGKIQEPTAALLGADLNQILQVCFSNLSIIEGLAPYVPDELIRRLIPNPSKPILHGSHRPVTVMFANFIGIDEIIETLGEEHEDAICEILNTYFVEMSATIAQYGGTISRVDSYVVGQRILAQFGALRAHEDDPQRAIHAGLEMNKALEQVNHRVGEILGSIPDLDVDYRDTLIKQRIGINSGFVFAGDMGSKDRREYTVMGDQVNLTARLMSVSQEDDVLIGQSTARQVEGDFRLDERSAVKVKGKTDPVRNFVVRGVQGKAPQEVALPVSPIIGRDKELNEAQETIDKVLRGSGHLLVIRGASGIGKTRLVEEIISRGNSSGMDLLMGSCVSYGNTLTYHPWAEILRNLFGLQPSDEPQKRIKAVELGMDAMGEPLWTPVIGAVIGLDVADNELTRDLDAKLRRQRVLDLIVKLLHVRAQDKPLVLVIEDAHWADSASMDLINYVARNIVDQPILFVLPHRPDDGLPDWTASAHAVGLDLMDLKEDAILGIVESMIGPVSLPDATRELILSKASGNPFFVGEVVRALMDAGVFKQDPSGNWKYFEADVAVELPDTIHGIVISRIDRLNATDRRILQTASVVGRDFGYQTLTSVYGSTAGSEEVHDRLKYMADIGLVEAMNIETSDYRFIHLTTREVVYESLSYGLRRDLHCQIGEYVEVTYADTLSEQIDLLAYHFYQGHTWYKALPYNLQAGERAKTEFANDIAITSFEIVLEATDALSEEQDVSKEKESAHESLGEVLTLVGQYEEALEHYSISRGLVETEPQAENQSLHLADLHRKTADVYERQSDYENAHEWLGNGLDFLDEETSTIEAVRIYILKAGVYHRQGNYEEAIAWGEKSLNAAPLITTREGQRAIGHTNYLMGGIYIRLGKLEQAVELSQRSVDVYKEIDHIVGQGKAYNNLGTAYTSLGEWDLAGEALEQALKIFRKIGDVQEQGFVLNNLGNIYLNRGEWDQAEALFQESNAIWQLIGAALPDAVTRSNLGQVYLYKEDLAAAESQLSACHAIFMEIGSEIFLPELQRRWGEYYLLRGDIEQALERVQSSINHANEQDMRLDLGLSYRLLGAINTNRREFKKAEEALRKSHQILVELKSEIEAARTIIALCKLALEGHVAVDRSQLKDAVQIFKQLGAQADLKQAQEMTKLMEEAGLQP
jgi:class 3 adenylate cyclase/tetratricopeptide (TPR) repeat protein